MPPPGPGFLDDNVQPRYRCAATRRRLPPLIPGPDQVSREGDASIMREVAEVWIKYL
jgi:hypothetical protein